MKKFWLFVFLATACWGVYRFKFYNPWDDLSWISRHVVRICASPDEKSLSDEDKTFLTEFPSQGVLNKHHVSILFRWVTEKARNQFVQYSECYWKAGFPAHQESGKAEELANFGGDLLKENSFILAGNFFEKASLLGEGEFESQTLALWSFFSGYSFESGGQTDAAIEQYKKSLSHSENDHRPSRQLGLIYFEKAKINSSDNLSRALARKYLSVSLKINGKQNDLQQALVELIQLETQSLMNLNKKNSSGEAALHRGPYSGGSHARPRIPDPTPQIPSPGGPRVPKPGIPQR